MKMMSRALLVIVATCIGAVHSDDHAQSGYNLPSGADLVVGNIHSTFSCDGRIYGYYADQDNNCQIFHVCNPEVLADGSKQMQMFSFFCNDHNVFDQQHLTCVDPSDALPCEQANTFYSVNENFGKTD